MEMPLEAAGTPRASRPVRGPHGGWQAQEIEALRESVEQAGQSGESLRSVFEKMGKTLGKDAEQGKLTVVSLHGVEGARAQVRMLLERAMTELDPFGAEAQFFRDLIASMVDRTK